MAYTIKNADGTVLLNLVDGTVDTQSTSLTLIGKNTDAYGTALNTNLVNILQNFASNSQPRAPLVGQLWYSKADGRLKVYTLDGIFQDVSASLVSSDTPTILKQGDLWINSTDDQLYFTKDGVNSILAGPIYSKGKGKSGWVVETFKEDVTLSDKTVTSLYSNNVLVGILSTTTFKLSNTSTQNTQGMFDVYTGLSLNLTIPNVRFAGTASNATAIAGITPNEYLLKYSVTEQQISGGAGLTIVSDTGLTLGNYLDMSFLSAGTVGGRYSTIRNNIVDAPLYFVSVKSYPGGPDGLITGLTIKQDRVGIFTQTPSTNFHVVGNSLFTGDVTITKNLTVNGTFTTVLSEITQIIDKNIELAYNNTLGDVVVDGGGITLRGATDKLFAYSFDRGSWNSNIPIGVNTGSFYQIGGVAILTSSTIGASVTQTSITRLGILEEATITNVIIKGSGIEAQTADYGIIGLSAASTASGAVITVNLATPVPIMNSGTTVTITGIVASEYNHAYPIRSVTSATQFTVLSTGILTTANPGVGASPQARFTDLILSSKDGGIDLSNKRIKNLQYSNVPTDAATVQFAMDAISIQSLKGFVITIDVTQMIDQKLEIAALLNILSPPVNTVPPEYPLESQYDLPVGYRARVLCQTNTITVPARPINVTSTSTLVVSYPAYQAVGALTQVSVTAGTSVTTATMSYSVKEFRVVSGSPNRWAWYTTIV
jgi:hypothetical protein